MPPKPITIKAGKLPSLKGVQMTPGTIDASIGGVRLMPGEDVETTHSIDVRAATMGTSEIQTKSGKKKKSKSGGSALILGIAVLAGGYAFTRGKK